MAMNTPNNKLPFIQLLHWFFVVFTIVISYFIIVDSFTWGIRSRVIIEVVGALSYFVLAFMFQHMRTRIVVLLTIVCAAVLLVLSLIVLALLALQYTIEWSPLRLVPCAAGLAACLFCMVQIHKLIRSPHGLMASASN